MRVRVGVRSACRFVIFSRLSAEFAYGSVVPGVVSHDLAYARVCSEMSVGYAQEVTAR